MSMRLPWPLHTYPGVFWLVLWRAKKPLKLTLLWISRSSHYTSHICEAKKTHNELLGTSRVPWSRQSKNPDGDMYVRMQECNLGHINQQLSATKRASAHATCAALLCKQLPGPLGRRGCTHWGEEPGTSHPFISSGSWGKEENHHRLLLSDALHFLAEEALLCHAGITGSVMGTAAKTAAGLNTLLQPPAPHLYINKHILCSLFFLE